MAATRGSYVLVLEMVEQREVKVGRLGLLSFESGFYCYCGSAISGLEGRLARHARQEKKVRWHIDYLLPTAVLVEVWVVRGDLRWECQAQKGLAILGGKAIGGFGSSDCRCAGHLMRFSSRPGLTDFNQSMQLIDPVVPPAQLWWT